MGDQMNGLMQTALVLVPHEALGALLMLFIVLGGLCLIVGARQAATALITTAIAIPFVTVVVEALFSEVFNALPPYLVKPVAWLVLGIAYLAIFGTLMRFVFGEEAWNNALGRLIADSIEGIFRLAVSWPMLIVWGVLALYLWI